MIRINKIPLSIFLLFMLSELHAQVRGQEINFSFANYNQTTSFGMVVSDTIDPNIGQISLCLWTRIRSFKRPSVVFSIVSINLPEEDLSIGVIPNSILVKQRNVLRSRKVDLISSTWYQICITMDEKTANIYFEGVSVMIFDIQRNIINDPLNITLGASSVWPDIPPYTYEFNIPNRVTWIQDTITGGYVGDIYSIVFWNEMISRKDIQQMLMCQSEPTANSVALGWTIVNELNVYTSVISSLVPCNDKVFSYVIFPNTLNFNGASNVCKMFNTDLINPYDNSLSNLVSEDVQSNLSQCVNSGHLLWIQTIDTSEGICTSLTDSGRQNSYCTKELCFACQINEDRKLFYLRGLCSREEMELSFVLTANNATKFPEFIGIEKYIIVYEENEWRMKDEMTNQLLASTTGTLSPIGNRNWITRNTICSRPTNSEVSITFTPCTSREFSCNSGECVPLRLRCNMISDCPDSSDETNCEPIQVPQNLLPNLPPTPFPVKISVRLEVLRGISVSSDGILNVILQVRLLWRDPRVRFSTQDIENEINMNSYPNLWTPKIHFPSAFEIGQTNTNSATFMGRPGTFTASLVTANLSQQRDTLSNDQLYTRDNSTLTLTEDLNIKVKCDFDFRFFPFDEHKCEVPLILVPLPSDKMVLDSVTARYKGSQILSEMFIPGVYIRKEGFEISGKPHSGAVLEIFLIRQSAWVVIAIYMPSLILMLINNASLWIGGPNGSILRLFISSAVLISLLILWVMTFTMSDVRAYARAVDVWLCFCTTLALLHILVHALNEIFSVPKVQNLFQRSSRPGSRSREVKPVESVSIYDSIMKTAQEMDGDYLWTPGYWILFISRVVSFTLVILFNLTYWPFVLYFSGYQLPWSE